MAYMLKDIVTGKEAGPFPSKKGEYCGNHLLGSTPMLPRANSLDEDAQRQNEYLSQKRFGRPRPCEAGTSEELAAKGYVGLYLLEDRKLMSWEYACETPPELMEPPLEEKHMENKHPEQRPGEVFLGNFTLDEAGRIGWKTKRSGSEAFCADGSPYPYQKKYGVRPWFADAEEMQAAGISLVVGDDFSL